MSALSDRMAHPLLAWFDDTGVTQFDLAVQRRDGAGLGQAFLAPRFTRSQGLGIAGVAHRLPWLRAENVQGHDIYFRPFRYLPWPVIFLDDLPPGLATRIAKKYRAAVIETSPGRCHLWLALTSPLEETQRSWVQKDLVAKLQGSADPGSVSGDHWGRLPGFRNRKPQRDCWVNLHALTRGHPYKPNPNEPRIPRHGPDKRRAHPADGVDSSRLEWGWVRGCLENGLPSQWVLQKLIEKARSRRGDRDAIRYARYTVAKACRIMGIPFPF